MSGINTLLPALQKLLIDLRFYTNCSNVKIELEMDDTLRMTFDFYPQDWHCTVEFRKEELERRIGKKQVAAR